MTDDWKEVLGCPYCQGGLQLTDGDVVALECPACGKLFSMAGGIPRLLRHEDAGRLDRFSQEYRQARVGEGFGPLSREQALALPYGRPAGYPPLYWQVRRQSYCALLGVLAREGPSPAAGPAADLGAGIGWLSYRLAQLGYRVAAVEASLDETFGLGAARTYFSEFASLFPIQGDLEHPPLQAGQFGFAVFNASLHYAGDLRCTLDRASLALRPGGRVFILDTPIGREPQRGTGRGDRHLGQQELHSALLAAGLEPRWLSIRRGWRWWTHQLKASIKWQPRYSFPMIVADLAGQKTKTE